MLPLIAGQLLREAVVGLNDLGQSRSKSATAAANGPLGGSNPLRTSSSVEQALIRLFESHGRLYGGPVDALREPPPYLPPAVPFVAPPKVGRNDPCPCGSGKKYKKCHGKK